MYLMHHGIKGQKWGVRRYQNKDGTLTDKGRARLAKKTQRKLNSIDKRRAQMTYDTRRQVVMNIDRLDRLSKKASGYSNSKFGQYRQKRAIKKAKSIEAGTHKLMDRYEKQKAKGLQKTEEILKKAADNGLTVSATKMSRIVIKDQLYNGQYYIETHDYELGIDYKVR